MIGTGSMTFCNAATAGTTARHVSGMRPMSLQGQRTRKNATDGRPQRSQPLPIALCLEQCFSHILAPDLFWHASTQLSKEHAFAPEVRVGCAAETPLVDVASTVSTTMNAEIRRIEIPHVGLSRTKQHPAMPNPLAYR
jgi:hypothetical protein